MRRFLFVLAFGLAVTPAAVAALRVDRMCVETCPDDLPGGQCPPDCHDCACCTGSHVVIPAPTPDGLAVEIRKSAVAAPSAIPPTPEPGEILHVPKYLLA